MIENNGKLRHTHCKGIGIIPSMQQNHNIPVNRPGEAADSAAETGAETPADREPVQAPVDPLAHVRHARRVIIIGQTQDGRAFRPSDWAERLAGVMACFKPRRPARAGTGHGQAHLGYSPYVLPSSHNGFKCVIVDRRLHDIEPLAHNFVLNFALDNRLKVERID